MRMISTGRKHQVISTGSFPTNALHATRLLHGNLQPLTTERRSFRSKALTLLNLARSVTSTATMRYSTQTVSNVIRAITIL